MKTINDVPTWQDWEDLSYEEKLDVTINTFFINKQINIEHKMTIGNDYGEATIELCCIEDDEKRALTEGWIKVKEGNYFEVNLWRGNGSPYYLSDNLLSDIYSLLIIIKD